MGWYINPRDMDKAEWLHKHGEVTAGPCKIDETHLPVCLVDNGMFTAAAVGVNPNEVAAFCQPTDSRPKLGFRVPRMKLIEVGAI